MLGIGIFILIFYLCNSQSSNVFWALIFISFLVGVLLIIPIGEDRHASGNFNANSYSGWGSEV